MNKKTIMLLILAMVFISTALVGCSQETNKNKTVSETLFLKNGSATYTKAQLIIPANYEKTRLPLVTLGHGFRGTLDSAGGKALAEAFAHRGMATIRMDYSHYADRTSETQTNQYTPTSMIEDQLLCIDYMVNKYNVDPGRVGLYGRSLGGRIAMTMANESAGGYKFKAMALVAPAGNDHAFQYYIGGQKAWDRKKAIAKSEGKVQHQGITLTSELFQNIEEYNPCDTADEFKEPVLVVYNLLDHVVLPKTSIECADAYEFSQKIEVSSVGGHDYEMSRKHSKLKDQLITSLTDFFVTNL